MFKRAFIYLKRKYNRSILLFLLLFAISLSLSIGLSVWGSIDKVTKEVQRQLGTSFTIKIPQLDSENSDYYKPVTLHNGQIEKKYCGPMLNRDLAQQVLQIDGVTDYNGELQEWVCADNIDLIPGMGEYAYQETLNNPDRLQYKLELQERGEIGGFEWEDIGQNLTWIYGNTDSSLYDKFRTGSFELIEGRHITAADKQKVLISDELAEQNDLKIGDTIHISVRGTNIMDYQNPKKILGELELEIVGIFHVNGYQPTGEWVQEEDITYNWLLTDEDTVEKMTKISNENFYIDDIVNFRYINMTFFVDDPARLNEIVDNVRNSDIENIKFFDISLDDTMYKSTVDPLNSIRNLITGLMLAIVVGCAIVLLIVFTMWVKSRRQEIAIYLSMGMDKASILGQMLIEAVIVAVIACVIAFPLSQPIADFAGNSMLASTIEEAQPEGEKEYSLEELRQAAYSGSMSDLFAYEGSSYSGPEQIDFSLGVPQLALLLLMELVIISGAICKGSYFLFSMEPKQIMTELR